MSDADIANAVAPFWRCPDWCNRGANYRAELDALRAENARLRAALERISGWGDGSHCGKCITLGEIAQEALDG